MQESLAHALEDLHERIAAVVLSLDEQALDWRPAPQMATMRELIGAAADEEYQWIGGVVALQPRVSPGAPASVPADLSDHPLFRLGSTGQISQVLLGSLSPAEWVVERQVNGQSLTVAACTLQVLVELARALGQIELVAALWRARGA
jgi:hypothetical protein